MALGTGTIIEHGGSTRRYRILVPVTVAVTATTTGATLGTITDIRFAEQKDFMATLEALDANKDRTQALGAVYGEARLTNAATGELTVDVYGPAIALAVNSWVLVTVTVIKSNVTT